MWHPLPKVELHTVELHGAPKVELQIFEPMPLHLPPDSVVVVEPFTTCVLGVFLSTTLERAVLGTRS